MMTEQEYYQVTNRVNLARMQDAARELVPDERIMRRAELAQLLKTLRLWEDAYFALRNQRNEL